MGRSKNAFRHVVSLHVHQATSKQIQTNQAMSQEQRLEQLIQRLESVLERLEKVQPGGKAAVTGGAVGGDPKVEAYDEYVATHLTPLLKNCREIGGDLSGLADLIEKGFAEVRNIVVLASKSKKPSDEDFGSIVQPLAGVLQQITEYKDKRRGTDFYNHEYAVAEGIQCLAWVTVPNVSTLSQNLTILDSSRIHQGNG